MAPLLAAGRDAVPGRYVVVMHPGKAGAAAATAREVVAAHGGAVHHTYGAALQGFAATLSPAAVEALRRNPQVAYVAEDGMAYLSDTQNGAPWGLDRVDQRTLPLNTTYEYSRTGNGVRVYVIDSGIRTSHAEFGGRASAGADFVNDGQNGQDCNGHGTHVAGTIAGATYGVAKAAQVVSVRVFGCSGGAEWSTVIAAVDWVTANAQKPAVANMSLGGSAYTPLNQAVQASIASGVVYAVAAGNSSANACNYSPASTPEAITVGSTASGDGRSSFSNWGSCVDLFAPGSDITSAWWTSDTAANTISGTSMASPHAAGVAALYLQGNPGATPATVAAEILASSTADQITDVGSGSPNRLLFSLLTPAPPAAVLQLNPASLQFTFVRTVAGVAVAPETLPAGAAALAFAASGEGTRKVAPQGFGAGQMATVGTAALTSRVLLTNTGNTAVNWTAASNRSWLTPNPGDGALNAGFNTYLSATVDPGTLAAGTHAGAVAVNGTDVVNGPVNLNVTVSVVDAVPLVVGTPRTGLTDVYGSQRYYAVSVPSGATSLTIATSGGTGDADLYVRYGNAPTFSLYDCRPYLNGNVESCVMNAPPPGTYYVMLHGWWAYSGVTLSAIASGPPTAPQNLASQPATTTSVRLDWTDALNETGYTVSRRTLAGGAWGAWSDVGSPAANAVTFTNAGLATGSTHQYRVRACNAAGCSAWAEGAVVTLPTGAPAPPFNLAVAPASGSVAKLTWNDGSGNETSFAIVRSLRNLDGTWTPVTTVLTPAADATSATDWGLLTGREYRHQIRACNPVGCSAWTAPVAVLMPSVPAAPATLTGAQIGTGTVRVQWADASNETLFNLARAPVSATGVVGAFVDVASLPANQLQWDNPGLATGTYRYRIRACNLAGCSGWTTSAPVGVGLPPTMPGSLAVSALSATSIRVTWVDTSPVETSVQVYRALRALDGTWPSGTHLVTLPANTTLYDNTGLLSGRQYRYWVRACNSAGCSVFAVSGIVATP
jgi:serine protease